MNDRLLPVGEGLWLVEGPIVDFYSFPYPTRMVIAKLSDDRLWIWSPIHLDEDLRADIEAIGAPAHLVSPNRLHHLYLGFWKAAYPQAKLWGLPQVTSKRRDLFFDGILRDKPPADWAGAIDQVIFRGSFVMEEAVFFHKPSRAAIFADLIENFTDEFLRGPDGWAGWRGWIARHWGITAPEGMAPLDYRASFVRRREAREALRTVISWNPERVVMAHGEWQRSEGRAFVARSFRWLDNGRFEKEKGRPSAPQV